MGLGKFEGLRNVVWIDSSDLIFPLPSVLTRMVAVFLLYWFAAVSTCVHGAIITHSLEPEAGFEPTMGFTPAVYKTAALPLCDSGWRTGRDSNPHRAESKAAALPIMLPVYGCLERIRTSS